MARVNFYLLPQAQESARQLLACRLADKLWRQGMAVQLHCDDHAAAVELDALLWSFSPEAFVPHYLHEPQAAAAGSPAHPAADGGRAVVLSWGQAPALAPNLLHCGSGLPASHAQFDTIAEFVAGSEEARARSRALWQQYKQAGHSLQHHRIGA